MNRAISIRARLLAQARNEQWDFQRLLLRYASGRLLWRLAQSEFADRFILKGAQLFVLWADQPHRATRDLDLLGYGEDSPESMIRVFQAVSAIPSEPNDGLVWHSSRIKVEAIKGEMSYGGQRVQLLATLANTRIPLQIDVGFGDAVSPAPRSMDWPELLDLPPASIRTYPPETVIAEKLEAMIKLDLANSRMKDFHDLHWLSRNMEFDGEVLAEAVRRTFTCRKSSLPLEVPTALSRAFWKDPDKQVQWGAFCRKMSVENLALKDVIEELQAFLLPLLQKTELDAEFKHHWCPGGPWVEPS
jgi:hypothetical protein